MFEFSFRINMNIDLSILCFQIFSYSFAQLLFRIGAFIDCNVYTDKDPKFTSVKALFCLTSEPKFGACGDGYPP